MQRVVFERLPMRPCGAGAHLAAVDHERRVAAPPVAAAVAQVARRAAGRPSVGAQRVQLVGARRRHPVARGRPAPSTAWPCPLSVGRAGRAGAVIGAASSAAVMRGAQPGAARAPCGQRGELGDRRSRGASAPCRSSCRRSAGPSARTAAPCRSSRPPPRRSRPRRDATSITPTITSLPSSSADQVGRHVRVEALERHLVDRALRERRKDLLVLAPLVAERLLPVDVRLDAVAVADVHRRLAGQALARRARAPRRPSRPRRPCRR